MGKPTTGGARGPSRGPGASRGSGRGRGGSRERSGERSVREAIREAGLVENTVRVNRCAKVMKGGRRFSFSALVVVGDAAGQVGVGLGKANDVPTAIEKAAKEARRTMTRISLVDGRTLPHETVGRFGAARVKLLPAPPGTGVIAGASARAVLTAAGVQDVLTKSLGTCNPLNLVRATLAGLTSLRSREEVEALRGVTIEN